MPLFARCLVAVDIGIDIDIDQNDGTSKMKFGVAVPTCTEGLMYPVPYASVEDAVQLAHTAESLGFDSIWANEHVSTPAYVRQTYAEPPSFLDPWSYLAYVAAQTSQIKIATGVTVTPFRHPVLLAKHAATLDQLSGGRLILGVGIGAYREEHEAVRDGRAMHRGKYAAEALQALRLLFTERSASYEGEWVRFNDVESFPKPAQPVLPVLSAGNSEGSRRRAAVLADGWLPGCLLPAEVEAGLAEIGGHARAAGRSLSEFECSLQVGVAVGPTRDAAVKAFVGSPFHEHLLSLSSSTLADQQDDLLARNLIGSVDDVLEQIASYEDAGVTTLAGLVFVGSSVSETVDGMSLFMSEVAPQYGS